MPVTLHHEYSGPDSEGSNLSRSALRGTPMLSSVPFDRPIQLEEAFAGAPTAGFFAAGEIGPVGGAPFLHGFTATVAVFPR